MTKLEDLTRELIQHIVDTHDIKSYEDFTCPIHRKVAEELVFFKPAQRIYEVWSEGYGATGGHSKAIRHGSVLTHSFLSACLLLVGKSLDRNADGSVRLNKNGRPSIWACELFDNEADARKSFG